jgi:hypothetical protein
MYLVTSARDALEEFEAWLRQRFAVRLRELTLYSSRIAEGTDRSPRLDLLVVVSGPTSAEIHEVAGCRSDLLAKHGVTISPLVVSVDDMAALRSRERRHLVVESDDTSASRALVARRRR